jgi:hypothetical protein
VVVAEHALNLADLSWQAASIERDVSGVWEASPDVQCDSAGTLIAHDLNLLRGLSRAGSC